MPKPISHRPKVIGIVGSRRRNDTEDADALFQAFIKLYKAGDTIVSGGCPKGADRFAEMLAEEMEIPIEIHYPNLTELDETLLVANRRAAYAIVNFARNTLIAESCDVLIALVAPDRKGGTEDTVKKALKLGKKVVYA